MAGSDDQEMIEALFYSFRGLTENSQGVFSMSCFASLFPQLDAAILFRIYKLVFQTDSPDFAQFTLSLTLILRARPKTARLSLIFQLLVGSRMGKLTRSLSLDVVAAHLRSSLRFMGYDGPRYKAGIKEWEQALWPNGTPSDPDDGLTYGEFVMMRFEGELEFVFELFGLFDFLSDFALGQTEGRPPQKEGFLRKSYSNMAMKERWKKHWCVVRDGMLWYYLSDESLFKTPARVLTLQEDAVVSLLDQGAQDVAPLSAPAALSTDSLGSVGDVSPRSATLSGPSSGDSVTPSPRSTGSVKSTGSIKSTDSASALTTAAPAAPVVAVSEPGFRLVQGNYDRKFLTGSWELAKQWVRVLQANLSTSFHLRSGITARWTVDGKDTYIEMLKAMRWAKREIYITSWFFSAHVFLGSGGTDRLDQLLHEKASEGVRVFVLMWNETKLALDLNSYYSESHLQGLHPNIRVMRHPNVVPMKWSHHQKSVVVDQKVAFVGGLDIAFGRWDDQKHICVDEQKATWLGKNYYNPAFIAITQVDLPFEDMLDRAVHPRMGWHDVHAVCDGAAARDVAKGFIERWNHHKDDLAKDVSYPYLIPSDESFARRGNMRVKILRSICRWSTGVVETEASILENYLLLIATAEHFIYIENQYFISSVAGPDVRNTIADALVDRIAVAIAKGQLFRVVVILPVTPEGDFETDPAIRNIMYWQQRTIKQMLEQLQERTEQSAEFLEGFITFHSLRTWGVLSSGRHVSEQIYVHTKLIIADDRRVIVGSANINDRSMLGDRDSEMCLLIEDSVLEPCVFNGVENYMVSRFAHSLRTNLWIEHLGLSPNDALVEDPLIEDMFDLWKARSRSNTELFEQHFPAIASNNHATLVDYHAAKNAVVSDFTALKAGIKGFLVDHPYSFLSDEKDMFVSAATAAAVGTDVFV